MSEAHSQLTHHFGRTGWHAGSNAHLQQWLKDIVDDVLVGKRKNEPLLLREFEMLIETNSEMHIGFNQMFEQQHPSSVLALVPNYQTMLKIFNKIIQEAPFYGPIVPPMYMVLSGAMNTQAGFNTFLDTELNAQFKRMFDVCAEFLGSPASRYVLTADPGGWFSSPALLALTEKFNGLQFEQIFKCNPSAQYWGYKSWDDFFVRTFQPGIRTLQAPENPNIINAACESVMYKIATDVQERDTFWLKVRGRDSLSGLPSRDGIPSLALAGDGRRAPHRAAPGDVLLPVTRHDWRDGLPLPALAARTLVFIESDNQRIGLMCFIAVGMAEVSTCETTVKVGDHITRGDELGMFHFGGSTHVLIFRPETKLQFFDGVDNPGDMVEVRAAIAGVV
ncbi:phosphatidylserine decarboxylase [Mycena galericulata]|nr:phosphatidylserine decarboxylase [Mycena galericulata]